MSFKAVIYSDSSILVYEKDWRVKIYNNHHILLQFSGFCGPYDEKANLLSKKMLYNNLLLLAYNSKIKVRLAPYFSS